MVWMNVMTDYEGVIGFVLPCILQSRLLPVRVCGWRNRSAVVMGTRSGSPWEVPWVSAEGDRSVVLDASQHVRGQIPRDLHGTWYQNGPGLFEPGRNSAGDQVAHPLDGDGFVAALTISSEEIWFRSRFVRTKGFVREKRSSRQQYRGAYGTQKPGSNVLEVNPKNTSNESVVYWSGKLLSTWTAGFPYLLDPGSLVTQGDTRIYNSLPEKGSAFCPHPKILGGSRLVGMNHRAGDGSAIFIEYNSDFVEVARSDILVQSAILRDFGVSNSAYYLLEAPLEFDRLSYALGLRPANKCFSLASSRCRISRIPRPGQRGETLKGFLTDLPASDILRIVNVWERGTNSWIMDAVACENQLFWGTVPDNSTLPTRLIRIFLSETSKVQSANICDVSIDMPVINPNLVGQPTRFVYGTTAGPGGSRGLVRIDTEMGSSEVWLPGETAYCNAPVFAPSTNGGEEDDGYILSVLVCRSSGKCSLGIFSARALAQGPLCEIDLDASLPARRYGLWTSDTFFERDATSTSTYEIFLEKGWNQVDSSFSGFGLNALS